MKRWIMATAGVLLLCGCTANQQLNYAENIGTRRQINPKRYKELIKVVSFDTGCAEDQIQIVDKYDSMGFGMYTIQACGKELKYKRTGTIYHAADKSPIPGGN